MNKRTFYFLMDDVTGEFYTGQNHEMGEFRYAAVYYSLESVNKKIKDVVRAWEKTQKWLPTWKNQGDAQDLTYVTKRTRQVRTHEKLPQWGIQIIEKEIKL